MSFTETGILPNGVIYGGQLHRNFEIRERLVRDTVEFLETADKDTIQRASKSAAFLDVCLRAQRIVLLGTIPREGITPDLLLDMLQEDEDELIDGEKRALEKSKIFRSAAKAATPGDTGVGQAGIQYD